MPGHANTLSVTTAPDAMMDASSRTTVANGSNAWRSACLSTMRPSPTPRARAAFANGCAEIAGPAGGVSDGEHGDRQNDVRQSIGDAAAAEGRSPGRREPA